MQRRQIIHVWHIVRENISPEAPPDIASGHFRAWWRSKVLLSKVATISKWYWAPNNVVDIILCANAENIGEPWAGTRKAARLAYPY